MQARVNSSYIDPQCFNEDNRENEKEAMIQESQFLWNHVRNKGFSIQEGQDIAHLVCALIFSPMTQQ